MDLSRFKITVDHCPDEITQHLNDLSALYTYVGLPDGSSYTQREASKALYAKISAAFTSGHQKVVERCRTLREELVHSQIIDGEKPDPYFAVLDHLEDAVRSQPQIEGDVSGDWDAAIHHAYDHVWIQDFSTSENRERTYARFYAVARAAKRLKDAGITLVRNGHLIYIDPASEDKLVTALQERVSHMGGISLCRRIFRQIAPLYDGIQERYHVVSRPGSAVGGTPQIPFGYLLLLAAKHFSGTKPKDDTNQNWGAICQIATDYASVLDVQVYKEFALYDTLFRIPQIRGSDIERIAHGLFGDFNPGDLHGSGWSISDVISVTRVIMDRSRDHRGPVSFTAKDISSRCPNIDKVKIKAILDEVLAHPPSGPNQEFAKPTDAPTVGGSNDVGHNFFQRPLVSSDCKTYWLLDHAMGALPCLEAMLAVLRSAHKDFDGRLGLPIERFLRAGFGDRNVPTLTGKYVSRGEDGECDIVVETTDTIIFFELKKKPLTRRAQAGSEAHALLDLAHSLLAAQLQAGWHELRLKRDGFLDLNDNGHQVRLELRGRHVERVAVSLTQFGSFQDRVFVQQYLEATLHANFSVTEPSLQREFAKLTALLDELREQINQLHPGAAELDRPFFHCWFLSVPQILILLDDTHDATSFRQALWKTRHIITGSSDFYHDYAWFKRAENAGGG
jgi:hypothetical protein